MKKYLSTNEKLKRDGIYSFGIPALKAADGSFTCPNASQCAIGCYARQGRYAMPNVKQAQETRLALTKSPEFISTINNELAKTKAVKIVRIHDSGDFYNENYLASWESIALANPKIQFYAYTKMVELVKKHQALKLIPNNLKIIFSYGGKQDDLIVKNIDAHSRVFSSLKELKAAKYINTTKRDINALKGIKIGLVYHGFKSRIWSTEKHGQKINVLHPIFSKK